MAVVAFFVSTPIAYRPGTVRCILLDDFFLENCHRDTLLLTGDLDVQIGHLGPIE